MNNNALIVGVIAVIIVVGALIWAANRSTTPVTTVATQSPEATEQATFGDPDIDTEMDMDTMATASPLTSPGISGSPLVSPGAATGASSVTAGTVKNFTVSASNFKFAPTTMTVKQGDTVQITFKNVEGMHDWNLDEFNAHAPVLQAGQQATVQFVATKAGSFEYYCSVGNHRQMGMKGTLTVE